jgi:hypothetical protein
MAAVGALFSGLAMMVIACFAPWMLFKLVHFIGGDVLAAHHHGFHQSVMAAGATPVAMARTTATRVAGVVGGGGAGASVGTAAGPATASSPPTVVPTPKSLANNPVIKGFGGADPAGGATGPSNDGPTTHDPPAARPPDPPPPATPRPDGPRPRPQPAPMPSTP